MKQEASVEQKERILLIRKGNELYNSGRYDEAIKLYLKANYHDGIMRVVDYYYYDLKQPLVALKFYRLINRKDRIEEINQRIVFAFNKMLSGNTKKEEDSEKDLQQEIEVKIHPKLKILAEEIIRDNESNEEKK